VPNRRVDATIVMLARNGDLPSVVKSLKQMGDRFNKRFRYPYVFLNEEAFNRSVQGVRHPFHYGGLYPAHSYRFAHSTPRRVTELTDANAAEFGVIPHDHLVPARLDR
jgi:alpha 1,2-mannosyltransferase